MADELEAAKASLDALSGVFQLGATFSTVSSIVKVSGALGSAFPIVGAILGLIGGFLPDSNHIEILHQFNALGNKIDQVRFDIQVLKTEISWEHTELRYADDVGIIQLGMQYCLSIGNASDDAARTRHTKGLTELCAHAKCTVALNSLLDGMKVNAVLGTSTILDKYYNKTEGDRPRISDLATRLLQVLCKGMMVISTYDTILHGKEGAADARNRFYSRLIEARVKAQSVLDKCVENFRGNMLKDLNKKLDEKGSNENLVSELSAFMRDKYDWLENYCLVYNDLNGYEKHCIGGNYVHSFHLNGKCGVVFYRGKRDLPRYSHRFNEAYEIVNDDLCGRRGFRYAHRASAVHCYRDIESKMDKKSIGWSGCAVIQRGPDLWFEGTFSTQDVYVIGSTFTKIILLE